MRAVRVRRQGGPEVLEVVDLPVPPPAPGQVLVRHHAIGVNFVDVLHRQGGHYPVALPFTPGVEAAGVVEQLGADVTGLRPGDRVVYTGFHDGVYAEAGVAPADRVVPLTDDTPFDLAAATAMQGGTAAVLLAAQPVREQDVVVVTAGGGGVGALLTQAATAAGARVVATASSPAKQDYARDCGAVAVTDDYAQLPDLVAELTGGQGAVVAYDAVGADAAEGILASLAVRGHYVLYGKTSGAVTGFDLDRLSGFQGDGIRGALRVSWVSGHHYLQDRQDLLAAAAVVEGWLRDGVVRPRIAATLPLEGAAEAHRMLESREVSGKILLRP